MKEMGLMQYKTDLCVWKLVKETSQGPQLQVLVLLHIDHFMLAGWEEFQRRMHSKWKGSEWRQGHFAHGWSRRVTTSGRKFHVGLLASVTEQEKTTLRGLWGAMQWPCTQRDAKRACAVSVPQSSLPIATVGTLMKSNRILKEMKADLVE